MGNVKFQGSLGCSDPEMVEFRILGAARKVHNKLTSVDPRGLTLGSTRICLVECHGIKPWREEGAQESW